MSQPYLALSYSIRAWNLKDTASEPHIFNSMAVATKTTTVQPQNSTAMMTHCDDDRDSDPKKH